MRIVKGEDFTLWSPVFVDTDRETPRTGLSVSATVTREDGTEIDTLSATAAGDEHPGVYAVTLTADDHTNQCDRLTVAWEVDA